METDVIFHAEYLQQDEKRTWTLKGNREGSSKGVKGNGMSSGIKTKGEQFEGEGSTIITCCRKVS